MIRNILRNFIIPICTALGIRFLAYAVATSQHLSSLCYSRLSRLCGLPPCGVFRVQDSAIVIVGGEGESGRTLALSFSELGYTVFTLHLAQQSEPVTISSVHAANSSAALLYSWHKKKELSARRWGPVAPIALDMSSGADRQRASDTIKAYCTTHSLHLVALISLFASPQPMSSDPSPSVERNSDHSFSNTHLKRRSIKDFSQVLMWSDMVAQSVREPIVIFQDYIDMLARTSGRIIMLSANTATISPYLSASDGLQHYIARYLGPQLRSYGIKLCTVTTGHVSPGPQQPDALMVGDCSWDTPIRQIRNVLRHFSHSAHLHSGSAVEPSWLLAVSQEDVLRVLSDIVAAEYPKDFYYLGLMPLLSRMSQVIPTPIRLLTNSWIVNFVE